MAKIDISVIQFTAIASWTTRTHRFWELQQTMSMSKNREVHIPFLTMWWVEKDISDLRKRFSVLRRIICVVRDCFEITLKRRVKVISKQYATDVFEIGDRKKIVQLGQVYFFCFGLKSMLVTLKITNSFRPFDPAESKNENFYHVWQNIIWRQVYK